VADLVEAVKSGDKRKTLIALRDTLADSIVSCESGRDMAALTRRLLEVIKEIDAMPDAEKKKTKFEALKDKVGSK
jgi:hypothetical protein